MARLRGLLSCPKMRAMADSDVHKLRLKQAEKLLRLFEEAYGRPLTMEEIEEWIAAPEGTRATASQPLAAARHTEGMGDRSKMEARRAETILGIEDAQRRDHTMGRFPIHCAVCDKGQRDVAGMAELARRIFCNECLELALSIALRRGR